MTTNRYTQPDKGELDWHVPLNENFEKLDRDVEIRDVEANRSNYDPKMGAKFFATDSGATYTGDGTSWNLVGYVVRAGGGGLGHYVNYDVGTQDEEINAFVFGSDEVLEVVRLSLPLKNDDVTESDVTLSVYEGSPGATPLVEVQGNEFAAASSDSSGPWVATSSPVTVAISNASGESVDVVPNVWANIRQ